MNPVKGVIDAVGGVIDPFPVSLQPGLFAAVCLIVLWFVTKRGLVVWRWGVRTASVIVATATGLLLYPEYVHTTRLRRNGSLPSSLAIALTPLWDRVLDRAVDSYAGHQAPTRGALGRPPIGWAAGLCVASFVLHLFLGGPDGEGLTPLADAVFGRWAQLRSWAAGP